MTTTPNQTSAGHVPASGLGGQVRPEVGVESVRSAAQQPAGAAPQSDGHGAHGAPYQTSVLPSAMEIGYNAYDNEIVVLRPDGGLVLSRPVSELFLHDAEVCDVVQQEAAEEWEDLDGQLDVLRAAVVALHGQAHTGCLRVCMQEPCRSLGMDGIRLEPPLARAS